MTRRSFAVLVATLATSALAACAESPTAPQGAQLAPAGTASKDTFDPTLCRSGWSSSDGRCL